MATNKKFVAKNGLLAPDAEFTGVTSITLPAGTTAERPQNPVSGMVRFNTDVGTLESYDGVDWIEIDTEGFATATQGVLATTALQPGDNVSELINDAGFLTGEDAVDLRDRTTHIGTQAATTVDYDNSTTQLESTNVQTAIDELANKGFFYTDILAAEALAWGKNNYGHLGDNTAADRSSPVSVIGGITNWKSISAGNAHTAALTDDGIIYTWGGGYTGRLGDGTSTYRSSPVTVIGGITNWSQISADYNHTAALTEDGIAYAWGNGTAGRLGDGTTTNRSSPVTVIGGITNWKQISAGGYHTAAVTDDGTAYVWGINNQGQLGDNTTDNRSSPVTVIGGITNWKQISASRFHTAAVTETGIAYAWGRNSAFGTPRGQLGDGTAINRSSPVTVVGGITNWSQISTGYAHTAALTDDGVVYAWGRNNEGQLGDGITTARSSPVSVIGGITNWKQISAGGYHTTALTNDGIIYAWGDNTRFGSPTGQLGDNTTARRSSPVTVIGGITNWSQISAGSYHTAAILLNTAIKEFGK